MVVQERRERLVEESGVRRRRKRPPRGRQKVLVDCCTYPCPGHARIMPHLCHGPRRHESREVPRASATVNDRVIGHLSCGNCLATVTLPNASETSGEPRKLGRSGRRRTHVLAACPVQVRVQVTGWRFESSHPHRTNALPIGVARDHVGQFLEPASHGGVPWGLLVTVAEGSAAYGEWRRSELPELPANRARPDTPALARPQPAVRTRERDGDHPRVQRPERRREARCVVRLSSRAALTSRRAVQRRWRKSCP
jgi:hypothetical protein